MHGGYTYCHFSNFGSTHKCVNKYKPRLFEAYYMTCSTQISKNKKHNTIDNDVYEISSK